MLTWLSLDAWLITFISIGYLSVLFLLAHWGQKRSRHYWLSKPWLYSLSLGVSCTSWAFFGTVSQAASTGAWLAPVYIGSIICMTLLWPMLRKMLQITKQQNLTSIADFIACRYDRSPIISALVTIIALLGIMPYIALQLRAISTSFDLITGTYQSGISTALVVTSVLIVFSILFGTQQLSSSKQNQGLVVAIAFSSVVKLVALSCVGIYVTFFLYQGVDHLLAAKQTLPLQENNNVYLIISQTILGAITVFILPQQFHMLMIENHQQQELKLARWLYPLYLIAINLFILPIAIAGQLSFPGGSVDADTYVLTLPLYFQQGWLAILVYVGGLAAASSMVVVAAIVLSTMLTNEIVSPVMLRLQSNSTSTNRKKFAYSLLNAKRVIIALILIFSFSFERLLDQQNHLASLGLLSFALIAQFAPATIGALYWKKANKTGTLVGLIIGSVLWFYTLLIPSISPNSSFITQGLFNLPWLKATALWGLNFLDPISHGVLISLLANVFCYVLFSWLKPNSIGEQLQAEVFLHQQPEQVERQLSKHDLLRLLQRFTDSETSEHFNQYAQQLDAKSPQYLPKLTAFAQAQLSGILGSASTRMVMKAAVFGQNNSQHLPLDKVASIVDEANQLFEFNRELLQAGVQCIEQGISVIDADMKLVAWNKRYIELLDYPEGLVKVGTPIADLIKFNAKRGIISGDNLEQLIAKRLEHMQQGHRHHIQRTMPNGKVLEIRGQAMPKGGFVSTFTDITEHIEAEKALQSVNEELEHRVSLRTRQLEQAKADAEAANQSKTRFLAAASHDLMQPFNALTLFTSLLQQQTQQTELAPLAQDISNSLSAAEAILSDLVEISKLDSGYYQVESVPFNLDELLHSLYQEFQIIAQSNKIEFRLRSKPIMVRTDKNLLRRILQNFLSNAIKYGNQKKSLPHKKAKVLLAVRMHEKRVTIEVRDNGPGISAEKHQLIFKEFERVNPDDQQSGLGLGLAICDRISKLLNVPIDIRSKENQGACFSLSLPVEEQNLSILNTTTETKFTPIQANEKHILVIDNDELVIKAMQSLISSWGYMVYTAKNAKLAKQVITNESLPDLIIADYHLDDDQNGVDLTLQLHHHFGVQIPCIINSADPSEKVREHTNTANFAYMRKPLKPIALKKLISKLCNE